MSKKNDKELYLNFDEYIRQGEPSQREAAYAWSTAIGLQAVEMPQGHVTDMLMLMVGHNRVRPLCALPFEKT